MTFTFDAWQFFRFAQPELINAYLCVCCWAVDALYLPENKRQRALCRRTPCVWYASKSTRINASRHSSPAYRRFLFCWPGRNKQSWYFCSVWKKLRYSYRPPMVAQSQCYSITCSWIQFLFLPLGVHAAMNTAGDCMCFLQSWSILRISTWSGEDAAKIIYLDWPGWKLSFIKSVIAPPRMAYRLLQPTTV